MEYSISNFGILDSERLNGISGHLRVKNESLTIYESIMSVIDFVDELIITYQKSVDDTEEKLFLVQKLFPEKIFLYKYDEDLIPFHNEYDPSKTFYSDEELDITNPKNLANFYNYGLVKIKYKYYLKIDGDQIYFKDKLRLIRDKLIFDKKIKNKKLDKILDFFKKKMGNVCWVCRE